jgi:signal transduction histidine kinase
MALIWPSGAMLAWSIQWGWRGGVGAAAMISAASLLARGELTRSTGNNIVLLLLAGAVIGYAVDLFRRSEQTMQQAIHLEAATRERERLARSIHDGVLQVLALVQRRGPDLGDEGVELARLAEQQQLALRGLLVAHPDASGDEEVDVAGLIAALASTTVTVATPAEPVWLPSYEGGELVDAVKACLDNVRVHVGPAAPAWVLLEEDDDHVVVSVRDQGPGFPQGRLDAAAADGRLGVAQSIRGRVEDIGGTATFTSTPGQGTEVELAVAAWPRPKVTP